MSLMNVFLAVTNKGMNFLVIAIEFVCRASDVEGIVRQLLRRILWHSDEFFCGMIKKRNMLTGIEKSEDFRSGSKLGSINESARKYMTFGAGLL